MLLNGNGDYVKVGDVKYKLANAPLCIKHRQSQEILEQPLVHLGKEVPNLMKTTTTHAPGKKKDHWQAKCHEGQPKQSNDRRKCQQQKNQKGTIKYRSWKKHMMYNTMKWICTITIDANLDEVYVDDATVTCHIEAYTVLQVPADDQYTG